MIAMRDFSPIDCDEHTGHSGCGGTTGRNGLIFCDVQQRDMGFKENCYDRKTILPEKPQYSLISAGRPVNAF